MMENGSMIKSKTINYKCPKINDEVLITFHYIDDRKKNIRTEGKMEDCDSTRICGVQNESGGYEWKNCPVLGKKISQLP
jgi:hypothetical protein